MLDSLSNKKGTIHNLRHNIVEGITKIMDPIVAICETSLMFNSANPNFLKNVHQDRTL